MYMKTLISCCMILTFSVSCQQGPKAEDLKRLAGYWEIEKVVSDDGTKEYTVNETIDHFSIKGQEGTRTKVRPRLDGRYSKLGSEQFRVIDSSGHLYLEYHFKSEKWIEGIEQLDDKKLVLSNPIGIEYHFKRPVPFSVK